MSKNFTNVPDQLAHGLISADGELAKYDQIIKSDNESDGSVVSANSNDLKAMITDITTAISTLESRSPGNLSDDDRNTIARLRQILPQLEDLNAKISADSEVTEIDITPGTSYHIDDDETTTRYNNPTVTITNADRTNPGSNPPMYANKAASGIVPGTDGFFVMGGKRPASVTANTVLAWAQDTQATAFEFIRTNAAGQLQINNYLSAITNTDTASHHATFARRPGRANDVISGSVVSLDWNFPTITGTLRDDSVFNLRFSITVNDRSVGDFQVFHFSINRSHHPAGNATANWDDVTAGDTTRYPGVDSNGWITENPIRWRFQSWRLQWRIREISSQKVFEWRVHPDDLVNGSFPSQFSLNFSTNDITYYLSNGRAATDQWTNVSTVSGDWAGSNTEWHWALQVHPRANGFSEVVPVVRLPNGTEMQFNDVEMTNQNPVRVSNIKWRQSTDFKFFVNNFSTNLTHSSLAAHLRNFDLEYCFGYALNRTLGTETTVDGDLDIINDGKLKFNGVDAKAVDLGCLSDYTFNVRGTSHSDIVDNCYVVQPEDHGQLIAINPGSTVIFVILPQTLWTTEYNFKVSVTLDASNSGLVRVACPHIIGRPNATSGNAASWVKANNTSSGLPTALRYPDNSATAVNYQGYDYFDLWWARDWADFNMVNSAGWCGTAIRWFEAFQPPANPGSSQILGNNATTFSASLTSPTRTITVNKFRPFWQADA